LQGGVAMSSTLTRVADQNDTTSPLQLSTTSVTAKGGGSVVNNTAFGTDALISNGTALGNTAFGALVLTANTTGGSNVAVGESALGSNTTASNNTAVGYQAGYSQTTGGASAGYNAYFGQSAGYASTGYQNTLIGRNAGSAITSGNANTILGQYNGNQGGLDIRTASNYIVLSDGDGNPRLYLTTTGTCVVPAIYSDTTANAANVQVDSGGVLRRSTSALKYKQDIRDIEAIDINLLRGVRYKSKSEQDDQTIDHFGIVADEVDAAGLKELVTYGADGEVEGFQYERLTVVLLKAIQELKAEVDSLKAQINGASA
jgi:hypothetical protein